MENRMDVEELLSPRILKNCWELYLDQHYKHAAHEAMTQVELALKEKKIVEDKKYGRNLIVSLLTVNDPKSQYVKLHVPLGEDLQEDAKHLFNGAFAYYRNYSAHDGSKIDQKTCIRVMLIASELLDLIDASYLSFSDIGGVPGLIKNSVFQNQEDVVWLLEYLSKSTVLDQDYGAFYEELFMECGLDAHHVQALNDLDLVRYQENTHYPNPEEVQMGIYETDIGSFVVTDLGKQFLEAIQQAGSKSN
jgi:uncharacterized protein (TIGR02391 family)